MPALEWTCPICQTAVDDGDVTVFMHGDLIHLECWEGRAHRPRRQKDDAPESTSR